MAYIDPTTGFSTNDPGINVPALNGRGGAVPTLTTYPAGYVAPEDRPNFLTAGLKAGAQEALGQLGSLVQGAGGALGLDGVRDAAKSFADARMAQAQAVGRPDLDANPWSPTGIGYQLAKGIPTLAAMIGAGIAVPEAAVPAALARLTGGAGAGRMALGAFGAQLPTQTGANIQSAERRGEPIDGTAFAKALAVAGPEAAIGSVVPARLGNVFEKGAEAIGPQFFPDFAKRIFTGAVQNAPIAGLQSAAVTAIDQNVYGDPNATPGDKARAVIDSFFHGAVGGGAIGGTIHAIAGGPRGAKPIDPNTPTADLDAATRNLTDQGANFGEATDVTPPPQQRVTGSAPDAITNQPDLPKMVGDQGTRFEDTRPTVAAVETAPDQRPNAGAVAVVDPLQGVDTTDRRPVAGEVVAPAAQEGQTPPKFTDAPASELQTTYDQLQKRIDAGDATNVEKAIHASLGSEIAARGQPGLPDLPLFTPEQMQARAPAVEAFRKTLMDDEDISARAKKLPLIANSRATSEAEMVNVLRAAIEQADEKGTASKTLLSLADRFGVTDATGSPRDLNAEMATAMDKARSIYDAKGRDALVEFKRDTIDPLQKLIDAHAEADKLRSAEPPPADQPASPDVSNSAPSETKEAPAATLATDETGTFSDTPPEPAPAAARVQALADTAPRDLLSLRGDAPTGDVLLDRFRNRNVRDVPPVERGAIEQGTPRSYWTDLAERKAREAGVAETSAERVAKVASNREAADARLKAISEDATMPDLYRDRAAKALAEPDPFVRQAAVKALDAVMARPVLGRTIAERRAIETNPQHPLNGDIIKVGDRSIVRKVDAEGRADYTVYDPATGDYGKLEQAPAAVRSAISAEEARDRTMARQNPEGPFTGSKDNVVTTDGVSPAIRDAADSMMRLLGMGNLKLFIANGSDLSGAGIRDRYKLFGDYSRIIGLAAQGNEGVVTNFGPKGEHFGIHLNDGKTPAQMMEDLWHEIGHIHEEVTRATMSSDTRSAVQADFAKFMQETQGLSKQDVIKRLRNRETAKETIRNLGDDPVAMTPEDDAYLRSYKEWYADGVAKAMNSLGREPKTLVDKFFAKIADGWRKLVSFVTGDDYAAPQSILDMLKNVQPDADASWLGRQSQNSDRFTAYRRGEPEGPRTVDQQDATVSNMTRNAVNVGDKFMQAVQNFPVNEKFNNARRFVYGWMSRSGLLDRLEPFVGTDSAAFRSAIAVRTNVRGRMDQMSIGARNLAAALDKKATAQLNKVMAYTVNGLDPRLPFDKHTWLEGLEPGVKEQLRGLHAEAQQDWRTLNQMTQGGGNAAYEAMHQANQTHMLARYAEIVHQYVQQHHLSELPQFQDQMSPAAMFADLDKLHDNPAAAAAFYRQGLQAQLDVIKDLVTKQGEARDAIGKNEKPEGTADRVAEIQARNDAKDAARADIDKTMGPLANLHKVISGGMADLDHAPNFNLGRTGDHFVAFKFLTDKNGYALPDHVDAFRKGLDDLGFNNVGLTGTLGSKDAFIRVETLDQAKQLHDFVVSMRDKGFVDPAADITRGAPQEVNRLRSMAPDFIQRMMKDTEERGIFKADPDASDATKAELSRAEAQYNQQMTRMWLDMLPDQSFSKVLSARRMVQGYNTDMVASFGSRAKQSSNAIANIASSPLEAAALGSIREKLNAMMTDTTGKTSTQDLATVTSAWRELQLRTGLRAWSQPSGFVDFARSLNYTYYLGASPAYMLMQLSQQPMLLLPELAKNHGFLNASKALGTSTARAFKVMRAVSGGEHALDAVVTRDSLEKGGIAKRDVDIVMRAVREGQIDVGALSRELGSINSGNMGRFGHGVGETYKYLQRRAATTAIYSETFTRVQAALAAADLYDKNPVKGMTRDQYVSRTIRQSLFDFTEGNASRMTSDAGWFGRASPLVFAFTTFQTQMIEKMYREMNTVLGRYEGNKRESAQWLMSHAAAATALAGTMGLPLVAPLAGAGNKIANFVTGKDDWDFEASYRNFLSDTFGSGVGEVLSKGLPRALGFDLSDLGDQRLMPFTKLLTDRRKFQDAVDDWSKNAMGAPFSMATNMAAGIGDISQGEWLRGAGRLLPIKGPLGRDGVDALRMALYGFETGKNQKLPFDASTLDVIMRAAGIYSATKKLYDEKSELYYGLKQAQDDRATRIVNELTTAIERGDKAGIDKFKAQANAFGQDHPDRQLLPSIGGNVAQRKVQTETARALGELPLGIKPTQDKLRKQLGF